MPNFAGRLNPGRSTMQLRAALKVVSVVCSFLLLCTSSAAMKNRHVTFPQPCDAVWLAAVAVAKGQDYRIISVSAPEQIISLVSGGAWWGERIISASLGPGAEGGCVLTVQSRYSGVEHSDGPDFIARVNIRLIAPNLDRNPEAYRKFKDCLRSGSDWGGSRQKIEAKCEAKLREKLEAEEALK
jgi:hypothetical protein